jgi:hypothetical protein
MIYLTRIWYYRAMEDEFNLRQLTGEPCGDLVRFMTEYMLVERSACTLQTARIRGHQK